MSMKDAYQQKLQAQLDEWKAEIAKLEAKAEQSEANARIEYNKQMEDVRAKQKKARKKMEELSQSGDDAWEDLKAGVELARNELGAAIKSASSRFK